MLRRSVLESLGAGLAGLPLRAAGGKPNVILISLDQLHAGRLHSYGNPRPTSPNLDRMAKEGVRLPRFYAASPWTTPSYGSMMTAQYPSRHGATLFHPAGVAGLKPDALPLAEVFRDAGYRTAAFINNSVAGAFLTQRGFTEYDEAQRRPTNITERSTLANADFRAPATNQRVFRWLDRKGTDPFFLFLLYFEPHSPYDPPPEHDLFKTTDAYPEATQTGYDLQKGALLRKANLGDAKAVERLRQLYDGKIHYIDHYVGELLDRLRRDGLDKNTIVLLTSDHGELIYSHTEDYMTFDHRSLYDPVLHVPFILWGAGIPAGRTVATLASHIDIAPTLLELAGLPAKPDAQGVSLVPAIRGRAKQARTHVFSEQDIVEPLRSVQDERHKLIWNTRTGRKQLFDLRADPAEKSNLAKSQPEVLARLSGLLEKWRAENERPEESRRKFRVIAEKAPPVLVVDEMTIGSRLHLTGTGWRAVDGHGNFGGGAYWTEPAKGAAVNTATWRPDNPLLGSYRISIWYGGLPEGGVATRSTFTVVLPDSEKLHVVDQTRKAGEWQELGVFTDPLHVTLTNKADGRVIVDAVKFERVSIFSLKDEPESGSEAIRR